MQPSTTYNYVIVSPEDAGVIVAGLLVVTLAVSVRWAWRDYQTLVAILAFVGCMMALLNGADLLLPEHHPELLLAAILVLVGSMAASIYGITIKRRSDFDMSLMLSWGLVVTGLSGLLTLIRLELAHIELVRTSLTSAPYLMLGSLVLVGFGAVICLKLRSYFRALAQA